MTKRNAITPATSGKYRVELSRTSQSPQWWEYLVIENCSGAVMAGGEVRGARHLAQISGDREVRKLEAARQPFYIPPINNGYHIPC